MADDKVCPSGGHCPTCGRGPQPVQFIFPQQPWYVQPWYVPIPQWQYPFTITSGGVSGGTGYQLYTNTGALNG